MCSKTEGVGSVLYYNFWIFTIFVNILLLVLSEELNSKECGRSKSKPINFNGEVATKKEMPWTVELILQFKGAKSQKRCGGTIISPSFILTAAHCLFDKHSHKRASSIWVNYNSTKTSREFVILVNDAAAHEKYDPRRRETKAYDIAILKLRDRLDFDDFVKPVCLPLKMWQIKRRQLIVAGWGSTTAAEGNGSDVLFRTTTKAMSFKECQRRFKTELYSYDDVRTICAYPWNGRVCYGNSGGPMSTLNKKGRYFLLGVFQSGPSCNSNIISVGVRVSGFLKWIKEQMQRMESAPEVPTTTIQQTGKTTTEPRTKKTTGTEQPTEVPTTTRKPTEKTTTEQRTEKTTTTDQPTGVPTTTRKPTEKTTTEQRTETTTTTEEPTEETTTTEQYQTTTEQYETTTTEQYQTTTEQYETTTTEERRVAIQKDFE